MPKQNVIQSNFVTGEVSPVAKGRLDSQRFAGGMETCENFIIKPQGGLNRRSGTKFIRSTRVPSQKSRLIEFGFSDLSSYVLEMGLGYINIYKDGLPLLEQTTRTIDNFIVQNNGGLFQVRVSDHNSTPFDTGFLIGMVGSKTNNGSGFTRVTTTEPHCLRTGVIVAYSYSPLYTSTVTRIDEFVFDIDSRAFDSTGTVPFWTMGLLAGDTVYLKELPPNGSGRIPSIANKYHTVKSVDSYYTFTLANRPYSAVAITNIGANGGEIAITTASGHGLVNGDNVVIDGVTNFPGTINGAWNIDDVTATKFDLDGSTYAAGADISGTWLEYPEQEELHVLPIEITSPFGYGPIKTITNASSSGGEYLITVTSHGYVTGDQVWITGNRTAVGSTGTADGLWTITRVSDDTFTLDGSTYVASGTIGTCRKYFGEDSLFDIQVSQSGDVIYFTHPDYPTYKLSRLDDDGDRSDWFMSQVNFKDGPYLRENSLAPTIDTVTPANGTIFSDAYLEVSGYAHTAVATAATAFTIRTITGAANNGAGLIRITSNGHGYATNDSIFIKDVGGVTAANGTWTITVITANTYDLAGSTFAGVYTSGGTSICRDYIEYRVGDQWRLARIDSHTSSTVVAVSILDNILTHIDDTTRLSSKVRKGYQPQVQASVNSSPRYYSNKGATIAVPGTAQKVDPNADLTSNRGVASAALVAGIVTSTYSGTFGPTDVGKYLRIKSLSKLASDGGFWVRLLNVNNATGSVADHSASTPMASNSVPGYGSASGKFVITGEVRSATITANRSGAVFAMFSAKDVGRHVRLGYSGRWTWGKITAFTSTSVVTVTLYEDLPRDVHNAEYVAGHQGGTTAATTGITYQWRLGAWSETTGYPATSCFHEQRLFFGRTDTEPQSFWGSVTGDFENFTPSQLDSTVLDDDSVTFALASSKVNPIKWIESGPSLIIGTSGGEWQVRAGSAVSEPVSPSNIVVTPHTSHGSSSLARRVRIGSMIMFVDRAAKKVRDISYEYTADGLVSHDVTYIAEHVGRDGDCFIDIAHQQEPNNIVWFVLGDGTLAALTWDKAQEVAAWHRHKIAGTFGSDSFGIVESICVVPNDGGTRDDLYMTVKRTINGATTRSVEMLEPDYYPNSATDRSGMRFLDSLTLIEDYTGTSVSGLTHLEGQSVTVVGDGNKLGGTYTVTSGIITLTQAYSELVIGLGYTSTAKSLPPEGGSAFGVSQGQIRRINMMRVKFLNSLTCKYGWHLAPSLNTDSALNSLTATSFFTGTKELVPNAPYHNESQWTLSTDQPYPLSILSVALTLECGD